MSYKIHFLDNTSRIVDDKDIYEFVSLIDKSKIKCIFKRVTNLCIYDYEFQDIDYIITLSKMYGPNPINDTDIQLIKYLQTKVVTTQ